MLDVVLRNLAQSGFFARPLAYKTAKWASRVLEQKIADLPALLASAGGIARGEKKDWEVKGRAHDYSGNTYRHQPVSSLDPGGTRWGSLGAHRNNCIVQRAWQNVAAEPYARSGVSARGPPSYKPVQCVPDAMIGDSCQSSDENFGLVQSSFTKQKRRTVGVIREEERALGSIGRLKSSIKSKAAVVNETV